ncbi:MAG TPA: chorismate-binding protein [Sphingorhabdus lacus]|nr:chorismate-binding protein [Sphingorhabdus lacus]
MDDARTSGASPARLYADPVAVLTAQIGDDVGPLLEQLRAARADGLHAAGFLSYDAGAALLPQLGPPPSGTLAWFGLFSEYQELDSDAMASCLPDPAGAWLSPLRPQIARSDYAKAFAAVQDYIKAGDIYQANLTFPLLADYAGDPLALYAALRPRAKRSVERERVPGIVGKQRKGQVRLIDIARLDIVLHRRKGFGIVAPRNLRAQRRQPCPRRIGQA